MLKQVSVLNADKRHSESSVTVRHNVKLSSLASEIGRQKVDKHDGEHDAGAEDRAAAEVCAEDRSGDGSERK